MSKTIVLTKGKSAIIDDDDYDRVSMYKWCVNWSEGMHAYRAVRSLSGMTILMHRFIMDAPEGMVVDHINHDMLDNRKENLRVVTQSQNMCNKRVTKNNTSGYKGVSWNKFYKKWFCQITINGKNTSLGHFSDPIEAAKAYDKKAKEAYGEFALLNFSE